MQQKRPQTSDRELRKRCWNEEDADYRYKSVSKTKFKVYLDGQFAFTLYKGELFRYRMQEDGELVKKYIRRSGMRLLKRAKFGRCIC